MKQSAARPAAGYASLVDTHALILGAGIIIVTIVLVVWAIYMSRD